MYPKPSPNDTVQQVPWLFFHMPPLEVRQCRTAISPGTSPSLRGPDAESRESAPRNSSSCRTSAARVSHNSRKSRLGAPLGPRGSIVLTRWRFLAYMVVQRCRDSRESLLFARNPLETTPASSLSPWNTTCRGGGARQLALWHTSHVPLAIQRGRLQPAPT